MITILTDKTNHKFKYEGRIELWLEEPFITIKADRTIQDSDELPSCGILTIDKFWIEDIVGITGNK